MGKDKKEEPQATFEHPLKKFLDALPIDRENPRASALDHMEIYRDLLKAKMEIELQAQNADEAYDAVWSPLYDFETKSDPKANVTAIKARIEGLKPVMDARRAATYTKNMVKSAEEILKGMTERGKLIEALLYQDGQTNRAAGLTNRSSK